MNKITPVKTFHLPSGQIIVSKTEDDHFIESTSMQDVLVDSKQHDEVRTTYDPRIIWKHLAPITDKWLCTVSTQVGCTYACKFCDVATLGFKRNLTHDEIANQIKILINSVPELKTSGTTKAKIGFARMGEPMQNLNNVLTTMTQLDWIAKEAGAPNLKWLPCFNTIVPSKIRTPNGTFVSGLDALKLVLMTKEVMLNGNMHLQISVNTTDEAKRKELFNGADVVPLDDIIKLVNSFDILNRTVTLNFIAMQDYEISVDKLMDYGLDPKKFAVKIIPLNVTMNSKKNLLETEYNYSNIDALKDLETEFRKRGIPVVTDVVAKCEEAALCCGQLVKAWWPNA